jgi:hypothetical protein
VREAYEFYQAGSDEYDGTWSASSSSASKVFEFEHMTGQDHTFYSPQLRRYILPNYGFMDPKTGIFRAVMIYDSGPRIWSLLQLAALSADAYQRHRDGCTRSRTEKILKMWAELKLHILQLHFRIQGLTSPRPKTVQGCRWCVRPLPRRCCTHATLALTPFTAPLV